MDADTAIIETTNGYKVVLDDADLPLITGWTLTAYASRNTHYVVCVKASTRIDLHRLLLGVAQTQTVDHANRNGLDNRRNNLRIATRQQQAANTRKRGGTTSAYRGVRPARLRWQARITVDRKFIYLGTFPSAEEAARAYDSAARLHFGPFATTNFPEEGNL